MIIVIDSTGNKHEYTEDHVMIVSNNLQGSDVNITKDDVLVFTYFNVVGMGIITTEKPRKVPRQFK